VQLGLVTTLVGLAVVACSYAWAATGRAADANIGAGLLGMVGGAITVVGVGVLVLTLARAVARWLRR